MVKDLTQASYLLPQHTVNLYRILDPVRYEFCSFAQPGVLLRVSSLSLYATGHHSGDDYST